MMKDIQPKDENSGNFEGGGEGFSIPPSEIPKHNELTTFLFDFIDFDGDIVASWIIISSSNQDYYKIEWKETDRSKQLFFSQKEFAQAKKKWDELRITFLGGDNNAFPY